MMKATFGGSVDVSRAFFGFPSIPGLDLGRDPGSPSPASRGLAADVDWSSKIPSWSWECGKRLGMKSPGRGERRDRPWQAAGWEKVESGGFGWIWEDLGCFGWIWEDLGAVVKEGVGSSLLRAREGWRGRAVGEGIPARIPA